MLTEDPGSSCFLGADIGNLIHCLIGKKSRHGKPEMIHIAAFPHWNDLDSLMKRFNVVRAVIDAFPETRLARDFAKKHKCKVYLCYYNEHQRCGYACVFGEARCIDRDLNLFHLYLIDEVESAQAGDLLENLVDLQNLWEVEMICGCMMDDHDIYYLSRFNRKHREKSRRSIYISSPPFTEDDRLESHIRIMQDRLDPVKKSVHLGQSSKLQGHLMDLPFDRECRKCVPRTIRQSRRPLMLLALQLSDGMIKTRNPLFISIMRIILLFKRSQAFYVTCFCESTIFKALQR